MSLYILSYCTILDKMYERQFKFVVDYDYLIKNYTEHLAKLKMYVIKSYYTYILIFFTNV